MTPFIVTLTGPSCAGKTTLEKRLKEVGFAQVISHTTREPRAGEENGKAYYFTDKSQFKRLAATGFFVESVEFNGNHYGVSAAEIQRVADTGKPIVVIVEPKGLLQIVDYCKNHSWKFHTVFIDNPGEVIAGRFLHRAVTDIMLAVDSDKTLALYAKRLGVMLQEERYWIHEVGMRCDTLLGEFNEDNIEAVIQKIERVSKKMLTA